MKARLLILILLACVFNLKSQDAHFSQFYASPQHLAPSLAGSSNGTRAVLNFRDQWPKIPGNYITYSFSVDHYFANINSGMGVYFFSDNQGKGKMVINNIGYSYSYKVKINKNLYFQPGISAYYYNRRMNYNSMTLSDQYSGGKVVGATSEVLPEEKENHADFSISALGYSSNFWFGTTIDHLMSSFSSLRDDPRYQDMKATAFGGYKFEIKKQTRVKHDEFIHAAFNYKYQSNVHQLDIGAYYNRNPFILGLWYRGIPLGNDYNEPDALIFLAGIKYSDFIFSYSYDLTVGRMISYTGGSHEISIVYNLPGGIIGIKPKYKSLPCPDL